MQKSFREKLCSDTMVAGIGRGTQVGTGGSLIPLTIMWQISWHIVKMESYRNEVKPHSTGDYLMERRIK